MDAELKVEKGNHEVHEVTVHVNNKPVRLSKKVVTGREIKESAIQQQVDIKLTFQLLEELGHGRTRVIADNDEVHVNEHSRFAAIAPDDNS